MMIPSSLLKAEHVEGPLEKPPCAMRRDLSQMTEEPVAMGERARELMQRRGERNVLPAWERWAREESM